MQNLDPQPGAGRAWAPAPDRDSPPAPDPEAAPVPDVPPLPPLLDSLCDATVERAGDAADRAQAAVAGRVAAFLQEPSPAAALLRWIGSTPRPEGVRAWLETALNRVASDAARIERMVSAQVNAVLHAPRFQTLEASWRGLAWLHERTCAARDVLAEDDSPGAESRGQVLLKVLPVSKKELLKDSKNSSRFEYSGLFKKVYDEGYGKFGGDSFGLLIGDYEFNSHPNDVTLLRHVSAIAAAAFVPFVAAAHPALLGLEDYSGLLFSNLAANHDDPRWASWRSLRDSDDARFLGLTLPHVLMRLPYADDGTARPQFRFAEDVRHPDGGRYLWGNAAYAFASVVVRAYATNGWFADIRGFQRGDVSSGVVADLPVQPFATDARGIALKTSVDAVVDLRRERELSELGLIPLCPLQDTAYSVFFSNASLQRPREYHDEEATRNSRLSSMLQYVLCASRFAHYLKAKLQLKLGSTTSPEELERELNNWLARYVYGNAAATSEEKRRSPLRDGRVTVTTSPAEPGKYNLTAFLQPHYQLDDLRGVLTFRTFVNGPR